MNRYIICCSAFFLTLAACKKESSNETGSTPGYALKTDKTTLALPDSIGAIDSFSIETEADWTITISPSSADWVHVSAMEGTKNGKVYVTVVKENKTDTIQKASISVNPVNAPLINPVLVTVTEAKSTVKELLRNAFGGTGLDNFSMAVPATGGGFIVLGSTESRDGDIVGASGGQSAIWVLKIDVTGKIMWQKAFGGSKRDGGGTIIPAQGGGYLITGTVESNTGDMAGNHGDTDIWVAKIDDNGNLIWKKILGGSGSDIEQSTVKTSDGGYIIVGSSMSNDGDATGNHGASDGWVVKLDGTGKVLWSKILGGTGSDLFYSVVANADNSCLIAGATQSTSGDVISNHGGFDIWLVKLDANGGKIWQNTYGGKGDEYFAYSLVSDGNGGFLMSSFTRSTDGDVSGAHGGADIWVLKIDGNGTKQWQKTYGGTKDEYAYCINKVAGNYIITGYTMSDDIDPARYKGGDSDGWIIKIDANGNKIADAFLGGTDADRAFSIVQNGNDSYIVGQTSSNDKDIIGFHGDIDGWLMKFSL